MRLSRAAAVVALFALVLTIAAGLISGVRLWNVSSGSMEPSYAAGDAVLTIPDDQLVSGEVYLYREPNSAMPIMHRLTGVSATGDLVFRGDANPADDPPVRADVVRDRVLLRIPGAGVAVSMVSILSVPVLVTASLGAVLIVFKESRR